MGRKLRRSLAASLVALAVAGCFNPFDPRVGGNAGISERPPQPDTPRHALQLFAWCWTHRDYEKYRGLFTDDFRFAFATTDSFGRAYLARGWNREDEIVSAYHLFVTGKADQPVATTIRLDLDPNLITLSDSRIGKDSLAHKEITTRINLSVDFSEGTGSRSSGSARFYLTRGDSALIPADLSLLSDSTRWYIERYEEQEVTPGGFQAPGPQGAALAARWHPRGDASRGTPTARGAPKARGAPTARGAPRTSEGGGSAAPAGLPRVTTWGGLKVRYR